MTPSNGAPVVKENQRVVSESDMVPLINLITNTIAPGTWRVTDSTGKSENAYGMGGAFGGGAGGDDAAAQPGSITPFMLSISLIIRHTAEVHEEVAELLKQLRRLQDLQVSIEVRFITVSDDFFEQIGVDFDFNIQSDAVGKKTTFAAANPAAALFPNARADQRRRLRREHGGQHRGQHRRRHRHLRHHRYRRQRRHQRLLHDRGTTTVPAPAAAAARRPAARRPAARPAASLAVASPAPVAGAVPASPAAEPPGPPAPGPPVPPRGPSPTTWSTRSSTTRSVGGPRSSSVPRGAVSGTSPATSASP